MFYKFCSLHVYMRVIQKVSSDWLFRKKQEYITNHVYCHSMYIPYTTFRHSFHHCWGTCHSVAPVFVSLLCRMMPPATTDGQPLRGSSCTFLCPSLNSRIHLRTIELLMACSRYVSQSWWISAGFMFFAFKKRITDRISHAMGFCIFLNIINIQHNA